MTEMEAEMTEMEAGMTEMETGMTEMETGMTQRPGLTFIKYKKQALSNNEPTGRMTTE